ncbi:MAG: GntR family transcriptional regulator [Gammaproteobacteria bacterium]
MSSPKQDDAKHQDAGHRDTRRDASLWDGKHEAAENRDATDRNTPHGNTPLGEAEHRDDRLADGASLTDRAYLELEERIATLKLKPGEVLSESTLSAALGIGRTPVREALQRLSREGMVTVLPRRGILVSEFNVRSHLRMLEVRREIERLMARSAAARASAQERAQFKALADEIRVAAKDEDDIGFMRIDRRFNRLVIEAARNEFATMSIAVMAGLSRRFWFMHHLNQPNDLDVAAERHVCLAEAIAAGDVDAAGAASDDLIDYVESITRAAVDW